LPAVLDLIVLLLLPGSLAFAAAMDLLTMTTPNRIALVVLLAFFPPPCWRASACLRSVRT
jgi:Flp pilus assembly protein protease CpaA